MSSGSFEEAQSPSLRNREGGGAAFEVKFLIEEKVARDVSTWAYEKLIPDPHGDSNLGGAYETTTLYTDTPELDVYRKSAGYRNRKYRVRRYGNAESVFCERKAKKSDRVRKRRIPIGVEEMYRLAIDDGDVDWSAHWFRMLMKAHNLAPVCRISYRRHAFFGTCTEGPLRLTMDRNLRGAMVSDWNFSGTEPAQNLLDGYVILELKFQDALPTPFKELVQSLYLQPGSVSKYRTCREAWGVNALLKGCANA